MLKPLVIYHADCTDGFGAAFAAWLKLGDKAEYLPMQYGVDYSKSENIFDVRDREVYILDFSFPRPIMEDIFKRAKRVVWLDHHKTAFEMWCGGYTRGDCYNGDMDAEKGNCEPHYIVLDDNKSGALLAWEYFHPGFIKAPMLIQHIDDRDRWQFKLTGSADIHAALASHKPWSFEQWRSLLTSMLTGDNLYADGAAILRAQDQHIASMAKHARRCRIHTLHAVDIRGLGGGQLEFTGLAVNATMHISEVGHELANKSGTYGLVWYLAADNRVKCSLRSNGGYDISAIAKAFGGGGHRNAAGFETDIDTLMGWLK